VPRSAVATTGRARARAGAALRRRTNWIQLAKFCSVGASGYVVNLAFYAVLLNAGDLHFRLAATVSFVVAATSNYLLNRLWTFQHQRGHFGLQGLRFFAVAVAVYGANLALLSLFVHAGVGKIVSQAVAIVLVTPLNFIGNKLWSFRR
jgi:putative flippase GtrA